MAKYETTVDRPFSYVLDYLHDAILSGSMTASYEDGSDFTVGDEGVSVRVYERYSAFGGNRLTLTLTVAGNARQTLVSAITSGGSQAMFFKINTFGEDAFLDTVVQAIENI